MKRFSFGFWVYVFWTLVVLFWWGLAFAPAGDVPPEWLVRTRNVCFGSVNNGLPDTFGWMTLILGPGSILIGLLYLWGADILVDVRRLATSARGVTVLVLLFGIPLAGSHLVGSTITRAARTTAALTAEPAAGGLPAGYPELNAPAPAFTLVNQRGEPVTLETLRGKPTVLTFAYAHCMTVCPIVMHTLKTAAESIAQPHNAVVVTLDPWRDTPRSLPSLAEKWKLPAGAQLLSGSVKDVLGMLAAYKAGASRDPKTGEISHPPLFYVVDAQGTLRYALLNPSPQALAEAVQRVSGNTFATVR